MTSFFDVDVQQLLGDNLYDAEAHAYVPITGPSRGEQPLRQVQEQIIDLMKTHYIDVCS